MEPPNAPRIGQPPRRPVRLADIRVEDVMSGRLLRCPPDASAREVASLMSGERIHCVLIEGLPEKEGGVRGWGVISDLDLAIVAPGEIDALTAGEIAATEPVTVSANDTLDRLAQEMAEHQVAHVLVVAGDSPRPVGVASTLDLARALSGPTPEEDPISPGAGSTGGVVLELSQEELRVTRTALQSLRDTFGHEEHELRDVVVKVLARLPV